MIVVVRPGDQPAPPPLISELEIRHGRLAPIAELVDEAVSHAGRADAAMRLAHAEAHLRRRSLLQDSDPSLSPATVEALDEAVLLTWEMRVEIEKLQRKLEEILPRI